MVSQVSVFLPGGSLLPIAMLWIELDDKLGLHRLQQISRHREAVAEDNCLG
jgi:hypothetical protein